MIATEGGLLLWIKGRTAGRPTDRGPKCHATLGTPHEFMSRVWRKSFRGVLGRLSSVLASVCSHDARNWGGLPACPLSRYVTLLPSYVTLLSRCVTSLSRCTLCHAPVTHCRAPVVLSPSVALRLEGILLVMVHNLLSIYRRMIFFPSDS